MSDNSLGLKDFQKKSKLAHAKGHGASGGAARRWFYQRVIRLYTIIFSVYVFFSMLFGHNIASYEALHAWLSNPINFSIMIIFFILVSLYLTHVILEAVDDYMHNEKIKILIDLTVICLMSFLSITVIVSLIFII